VMKMAGVIPVDRPGTVASSTAALAQSKPWCARRFHHHPHQTLRVLAPASLMGCLTGSRDQGSLSNNPDFVGPAKAVH